MCSAISQMGTDREVLKDAGRVTTERAKEYAETEYENSTSNSPLLRQ